MIEKKANVVPVLRKGLDRTRRVVYNGKSSVWFSVPQGSVGLGPLCVVIYINTEDLVIEDVLTFLSKFADDSKAGRKVNSDHEREKLRVH